MKLLFVVGGPEQGEAKLFTLVIVELLTAHHGSFLLCLDRTREHRFVHRDECLTTPVVFVAVE
jgi:hypothetical protein